MAFRARKVFGTFEKRAPDFSSVSPSSEQIKRLWVVCVYIGGGGAMLLVERYFNMWLSCINHYCY